MLRFTLLTAFAVALVSAHTVRATDFRITSEVFAGDAKEPVCTNITLFRAGLVYDYLNAPETVTVFDPIRGRFVLLDPVQQIQCEVPTKDVALFNEELKTRAGSAKDPLLQFMSAPQFKTITPQPNVVHLTSELLNYRIVTTRVKDAAALKQYMEFSDWYARLNTMVNPGSPPPFCRMAMNQVLYKRGEMPTRLELMIRPAQPVPGARDVRLRSEHQVAWKLLGEDLRNIETTGEHLATYQRVSFDDFIQAGQPQQQQAEVAEAPQKPSSTKPKRR